MYIDPNLITGSISEAYDTFANLGFEKTITIEDFNLNTGDSTTTTILGLQLNKDTIKVGTQYQFLTEANPSVFLKKEKMPGYPNITLIPDHSQRIYLTPSRQYTVETINEIFNLYVIRLKA